MYNNITIIGSNGAIGSALLHRCNTLYPTAEIHAFSRNKPKQSLPDVHYHAIDYDDETSIASCADKVSTNQPPDLVLVATGILHGDNLTPEKSLRDLSQENFQRLFHANTIVPALIAKHFFPKMATDRRAVFAAISARVGSISDNRIGGWYSYRASKAALNMVIKNAAIEMKRKHKQAIIAGLHPGTVDSPLSKPFQSNVPEDKLFTAEFSAEKLMGVVEGLTPQDGGKCFAWDGKEILP